MGTLKKLSLQTSSALILIAIVALNQLCICNGNYVPDFHRLRRLQARAARADPVEETCKNDFDSSGFSKLDKICKDCFNLIREPEIYQLCR